MLGLETLPLQYQVLDCVRCDLVEIMELTLWHDIAHDSIVCSVRMWESYLWEENIYY